MTSTTAFIGRRDPVENSTFPNSLIDGIAKTLEDSSIPFAQYCFT
jgi:hypothetical protein